MDAKFKVCLEGTKLGTKLKYDVYCKAWTSFRENTHVQAAFYEIKQKPWQYPILKFWKSLQFANLFLLS